MINLPKKIKLLTEERDELADTVELLSEQLQEAQGFSAMKSINIDELQARVKELESDNNRLSEALYIAAINRSKAK